MSSLSIEDRNAGIAARWRKGVIYAQLVEEFGLSAGRISTIVRGEIPDAEERRRIEHAIRSAAQDARNAELRAELLAGLSPCGCPGCSDPECDVTHWLCHHCRKHAVKPAKATSTERRTVLGYPLMYCTRACVGGASTNVPRVAMKRAAARRERVRVVVADDPNIRQAAIAKRLGLSQQTVSRDMIALEHQGVIERRPASEARAAGLAITNARKLAVALAALGQPGGCGSFTCRDPECQVDPGQCHHTGCVEPAARAPQTAARKRWVAGQPTLCCSSHGPIWLSEALREGRARGLLTAREAAEWLGLADISWYLRTGALKPDDRGRGRILWFAEESLQRFERERARLGRSHLDDLQAAERYYERRWLPNLMETRSASAALCARDEARDRTDRRRQQRARRRAGAKPKTELKAEWRRRFHELRAKLVGWSDFQVCVSVADAHFRDHPEEWPKYVAAASGGLRPDDERKAAQRVWAAIG